MQLFVTVLEETAGAAAAAVRAIREDHDGVEVRAERFPSLDYAALRAATARPILLTLRGRGSEAALSVLGPALAAGIDLVDVEWSPELDRESFGGFAERVVVSHHDYEGMRDVGRIFEAMLRLGCAHAKLAATPATMQENLELLSLLATPRAPRPTVIGMGERGLYSRIAAPFRGSALAFVAAGEAAAPGQLGHATAVAIYGLDRGSLRAEKTFAVAGNPAGHSLSPLIHNPLFRQKGVPAAYTVASFETFGEVAEALLSGELSGLSVTAPFKRDAFEFAVAGCAEIGENAAGSGSVNTLVRTGSGLLADNTDVDGFATILRQVCGRDRKSVAIVGAGGTARAARLAVEREGMHLTLFNRTAGRLGALPLEELARWDGEVLIDTTSADLDLPFRPGMTYIRASYGAPSRALQNARAAGAQGIDGRELLEAQAVRQHELFMRVFDGS